MRSRAPEKPLLTPAQCERLRDLLAAVPDGAADDDGRLIALLDYWHACGVPYTAVRAEGYRCRDGSWLIGDVHEVLEGISEFIRA